VCEFAAFLALYRDLGPELLPRGMRWDALPPRGAGVDLHTVDMALFGRDVRGREVDLGVSRARIARLAGALRSWLGWHPTTRELYLPPYTAEGGFRLHPAITTDWSRWCEVVPDGPARAGTADLEAAWSLVRGSLMHAGGPEYHPYDWADDLLVDMQDQVDTAGIRLSRRHRQAGNLVGAARVAGQGIRVNHCAEGPWRELIHTVHDALGVLHATPGSAYEDLDDGDHGDDGRGPGTEVAGAAGEDGHPGPPPEGYSAEQWSERLRWAAYDRQLERRRRTHGPLDAVVWAMLEAQSEVGFHYLDRATLALLTDLGYPPPDYETLDNLHWRAPDVPDKDIDPEDAARFAARTAMRIARTATAARAASTARAVETSRDQSLGEAGMAGPGRPHGGGCGPGADAPTDGVTDAGRDTEEQR
jgi:hypothetical protein